MEFYRGRLLLIEKRRSLGYSTYGDTQLVRLWTLGALVTAFLLGLVTGVALGYGARALRVPGFVTTKTSSGRGRPSSEQKADTASSLGDVFCGPSLRNEPLEARVSLVRRAPRRTPVAMRAAVERSQGRVGGAGVVARPAAKDSGAS